MLADVPLQLNPWGLAILLAAAVLHLAGGYFAFLFPDRVSLLVGLAGLAAILGGRKALTWSWPGVAFLLFMIPLPLGLGRLMQPGLQRLATVCSTYTLQTIGFPAVPEGNIILLHEARIGVVEACGGLSMLLVFFALATAVALLTARPLLDRIIVVASAIPIALAANVARITITAILHDQVGEWAGESFHDLAGWFMMPLALGMLWIELRLLAWVLVADEPG
jgi:exosortase